MTDQENPIHAQIRAQIASNPILLYMKGSPFFPQCGFSARAIKALEECGAQYVTVDILANPDIRRELPQISQWPTFPQLFIGGELIGGSDIMMELLASGELASLVKDKA